MVLKNKLPNNLIVLWNRICWETIYKLMNVVVKSCDPASLTVCESHEADFEALNHLIIHTAPFPHNPL